MNKPLFLRLFSTINFKKISLLLTLVASSSTLTLTTVNNNQHYNINTTDNNKISGFHITVTENNNNLVQEEKEWNKINDQYEDYVNNNQIINVPFNSWTDVINQFSTKSVAPDQISINVNNQFQKQLLDSKIFPITAKNYFTNKIMGRSIAKKSFNNNTIANSKSFGYVYVDYHHSLPTQITNGLFATVNPNSDFNNYFPIPYNISPSAVFLNKNTKLKDRLKIFQLGNDAIATNNAPTLVILAKKNANEKLIVKNKTNNVDVFNNDTISYALLNHNPSDMLLPTAFNISVSDAQESYSAPINLTNNCSPISFATNTTTISPQYLIKYDAITNSNSLIVMNKAIENATFKTNDHEAWKYWEVNADSLAKKIGDLGTVITDGTTIPVKEQSDFQVYCVARDTNDQGLQTASQQYIMITKTKSLLPEFKNATDLFNNKATLLGLQQYLNSSSNITTDNLKDHAGELLSWFIQYQGDIINHKYVNYLANDKNDNPWNIKPIATTKILLDHWNVVIISIVLFSLLITVPIVVVIIRKKKYIK